MTIASLAGLSEALAAPSVFGASLITAEALERAHAAHARAIVARTRAALAPLAASALLFRGTLAIERHLAALPPLRAARPGIDAIDAHAIVAWFRSPDADPDVAVFPRRNLPAAVAAACPPLCDGRMWTAVILPSGAFRVRPVVFAVRPSPPGAPS